MAYPANTCRAVFQFGLPNGTNGFCTPHFRKSDGGDYTLAEITGLADLLADWFENDDFEGSTNQSLSNYMTDECSLQSITITGLAAVTPPQVIKAVNKAGDQNFPPLPNETALVTTINTGVVGRSYRGRNFWPGLPNNIMDVNGTILTSSLEGLQDCFDALLDGIAAASSSELCVNSETLGLSTFATGIVVRDVLHHQRRRNS